MRPAAAFVSPSGSATAAAAAGTRRLLSRAAGRRAGAALSATNLACSRGGRLLFDGVGLSLKAGGWLQVTGPNGAGKTTLLRALAGLGMPDRGEVCWGGLPIRRHLDEFRRELLYVGHQAAVKDEFTPLENLQQGAALEGHALSDSQALAALERMGLAGRARLPARVLSAGQKRRLLLTRLLVRPATLWVLDEPLAALDADAVRRVGELLAAHLGAGGMAILTSHQPVPLPAGSEVAL